MLQQSPPSISPPALLTLAITLPVLVSRHTLPLATFYGEWTAAVLCVALITASLLQRRPASSSNPLPFLIVLIAASLLQALTGTTDLSGSRLATLAVLLLCGAMTGALRLYLTPPSDNQRTALLTGLAYGCLIAALLGALTQWFQLFRLEPDSFHLVSPYFYDTNRRLWGNLNQPNHQATVEGLALAATVWLASRGKLRFPMWLGAVILLESGIVLSGSRTGVIHVGIAAVYALIAAWLARNNGGCRSHPMTRPVGLVVAAALLVAVLLILQPAISAAGHAFDWNLFDTVAELQAADQTAARVSLWKHAWLMFKTHPWLGVGWGEFGWYQFEQLKQVGVTVEMSLHAHNAILDLLAKTGIIGAGGVAIALSVWLWRVVRERLIRGDGEERRQAVVVLTWLAMLCAHSMLEYPLHYLYFFLPFCFMLAWLEPARPSRFTVPGWLVRALGVVFVVVAGWVLVTMWQDYRRAEAREYADQAHFDKLPMPRFWFREYAEADRAQRTTLTPENAAALLPAHIAAVHLLPTPTMIARSAWLFALTGEPDKGREWLERLRYYYAGDEARQYAWVNRSCQNVAASARPQAFCDWIARKARKTRAVEDADSGDDNP